jgi:hypothetical protein
MHTELLVVKYLNVEYVIDRLLKWNVEKLAVKMRSSSKWHSVIKLCNKPLDILYRAFLLKIISVKGTLTASVV